MVEFIIGFGVGVIASIAIAALILAFVNRVEEPDVPGRRRPQMRDYDRESRIAAARLRSFDQKDIKGASDG